MFSDRFLDACFHVALVLLAIITMGAVIVLGTAVVMAVLAVFT